MGAHDTIFVTVVLPSFIFLTLGIVFLVIGKSLRTHSYSTVAVSVPLFPSTPERTGVFVGVSLSPNSSADFFPFDPPENLTIEFSLSELVKLDVRQDVYLLHNLWGYDISLTVLDGFNASVLTFDDLRNLDGLAEADVARPAEPWAVPEWARIDREMYVKCPTGHTLITADEEAEPGCAVFGGVLIPIAEYLQALPAGALVWGELEPPVRFVFSELTALPMDFVQVPQMFIASWSQPWSGIFVAGIVCLVMVGVAPVALWFAVGVRFVDG
jgi:hypothetical protein